MKLFSRRSAACAGALAVTAWLHAGAALAQEITLKLHHFLAAEANAPRHILDPWADRIESQSGGRIKVERYPAMRLGGKPADLIDQAIDGTADIVLALPGYTPGRFPSAEVFELPFMMTEAEATSRAWWDLLSSRLKDTEFKDVHVVAAWVHGPGVIHARQPIATLGDMKGRKLRAPTRMVTALIGRLGATPVVMPIPAITDGLEKGMIDGAVIPWEVAVPLKVPELAPNHTEFGGDRALYTSAFVLAMNKARYDGLPADLKKVIDDNSGSEVSALFGKTMQADDGAGRKAALDAGNTIIELGAAEVGPWQAAAEPIVETWIAEMKAKDIDGQALLDESRTLIDKYTRR
jgi:TRAP-type C4-dicarboxylate transport system substrate-binding protein